MSTALRAFMTGLVDYAGLFPPAALDVEPAVREYALHRTENEAWMLGRFIAPTARLAEIGAAAAPLASADDPWEFSVLVGGRDDPQSALEALPAQAAAIRSFENEGAGRFRVACLETALPTTSTAAAAPFVPRLLASLADLGLTDCELFVEVLPGGDDAALLTGIAEAAAAPHHQRRVGAKLRCGGVTPEAFPGVERVAAVITAAARLDLPLKCTAGLHHPVRHRAAEPDVMMHGFLNVFGAGLLAWAENAPEAVLRQCIAETDPTAFAFEDGAFVWRDHRVDAETVTRLRRRSLCGFGSCSFAEPRADLQSLGVL